MGFMANDAAFIRTGPSSLLRTPLYSPDFLNVPHFIGSFEIGDFIYFFFREPNVEHRTCTRDTYSRVGRVCKNDPSSPSMRSTWTTFLKARLNCSLPGTVPFYFNEAQDVDYMASEKMFYVTFTTAEYVSLRRWMIGII